jgi:hypothetical protein
MGWTVSMEHRMVQRTAGKGARMLRSVISRISASCAAKVSSSGTKKRTRRRMPKATTTSPLPTPATPSASVCPEGARA